MSGQKRTANMAFCLGDVVTLLIGPEETKVLVYKSLLVDRVPYFANCFRSLFSEAETNTIKMPERAVPVIMLFMHWLLFGTVPMPKLQEQWTKAGEIDQITSGSLDEERIYHKLVYTAEEWVCPRLAYAALDCIKSLHIKTKTYVHRYLVYEGFDNLHESSDFRRWLIDGVVAEIIHPEHGLMRLNKHIEEAPDYCTAHQDLTNELLRALRNKMTKNASAWKNFLASTNYYIDSIGPASIQDTDS